MYNFSVIYLLIGNNKCCINAKWIEINTNKYFASPPTSTYFSTFTLITNVVLAITGFI